MPTRSASRPLRIALVGLSLLLLAAPAAAQTVRGTVVEEGSGEVVPGAIVTLLTPEGEERGATLTDADGAFEMRASRSGRYRLRIERIGYETVRGDAFDLAHGETVTRRTTVPVAAVELSAIRVEVEDPVCEPRPDAAEALGAVWGEARKALQATRLSRTVSRRFEIVRTERRLDPRTRFVLREWTVDEQARGDSPFGTRPADEIADEGWATVGGERVLYYGPDVDALLGDDFLDRHCFRLVRDRGRIGLGFEPVNRGTRIEIEGVLWLDPETDALETLEFGYVGLPYERMDDLAKGRVEFGRLPDGRWIVESWRLRAPEIALQGNDPLVTAILETEARVRRGADPAE